MLYPDVPIIRRDERLGSLARPNLDVRKTFGGHERGACGHQCGGRLVRRPAGVLTISPVRHGLSRGDRSAVIGAAGHATTILLSGADRRGAPGDILAWAVETILVSR